MIDLKKVVAGIIMSFDKSSVLMGLKKTGAWEFPGGKIEDGETPEQALKRELKEELDAVVVIGEKFETVENDPYLVSFYFTKLLSEYTAVEHLELKWHKIEDLNRLEMNDTNYMIAEVLQHVEGKEYA